MLNVLSKLDNQEIESALAGASKWSNIEKISAFIMPKLKHGAGLTELHNNLFDLCQAVATHRTSFETAIGNCLTKPIYFFIKQALEAETAKRDAKPMVKATVIKQHTKIKVHKDVQLPQHLNKGHIKLFLDNMKTQARGAELQRAGIGLDVIKGLVGEAFETVEGAGAADPNIWGPVV